VDPALVDARRLLGSDQERRDPRRPAERGDATADGVQQLAG
jgi:hypothetical protein